MKGEGRIANITDRAVKLSATARADAARWSVSKGTAIDDHWRHLRPILLTHGEMTMWDILLVGYWTCVAIPVGILCMGIVTALRDAAVRTPDLPS
jgi:hypothetical protein